MESSGGGSRVAGAFVAGACALVGLALAGYFVGRGVERLRAAVRTVTVKGLVEKEVRADQAIWTLNLRRAGRDLEEARAFLKKQGFTDEEIERSPVRTIDKLAREYGQPQGNDPLRWILTTTLVV